MTKLKLRSIHIEVAVANHFGIRQNLVVPNVSWGAGLNYECDLLVVSPVGYASEVEIKVSKQDLKKDAEKRKWRFDRPKFIKRLFFAVPESLGEACLEYAPAEAGVLVVRDDSEMFQVHHGQTKLIRAPKMNKGSRMLSAAEVSNLQRLVAMRVWSLKEKLACR